jgi:alpha-beta hydrolase superfamily lysophospholipase
MYAEKYDPAGDTPKYLLGTSMGGLISSFISADESLKMNYDGAIYAMPYFDVHDPAML